MRVSGDMSTVFCSVRICKLSRQREAMFCSNTPVRVYRVTEIPDVYQALLQYEEDGLFRLLRYDDASAQKQAELTGRIASFITENNLLHQENAQAHFMRRYFTQAWRTQRPSPIWNHPGDASPT